MGARHLVVVNGELGAVGIITRADMNEHRLAHFWHEEVRESIFCILYPAIWQNTVYCVMADILFNCMYMYPMWMYALFISFHFMCVSLITLSLIIIDTM